MALIFVLIIFAAQWFDLISVYIQTSGPELLTLKAKKSFHVQTDFRFRKEHSNLDSYRNVELSCRQRKKFIHGMYEKFASLFNI